ncbi:PLAC8 family [Fragilaria crotonensis]|nr:PLAC8 family [Fragilaria crotonensis]
MPNSDGRGNSNNLNDNRAYYTEHLWSLKEQLHLLTTNGNEDSERILTYDGPAVNQVLDAVLNLNTNESIVEMDEIVGPAPSSVKRARESSPSPKRGGDRQLQSNAPQRSRRRSKERNFENSTSPNEERPGSALERGLSTGQDKTPVDASIPKVISFEQSPASNHAIAAAQHQWDDDDDMTNSIVERGTLDVGPTIAKEIPSVRVVAPANLPGGYQIDAQLNNESFKVTVPEGGVSMGQTFEAKPTSTIAAGESRWKAGLFDCLALGIVHPIFCNSFFFPQVALTQILTRLRISPLQRGQVASSLRKRLRIKTVLLLSTAFFLLDLLLVCTMIWPANTAAKIFLSCYFACATFLQQSISAIGWSNQKTSSCCVQYPSMAA